MKDSKKFHSKRQIEEAAAKIKEHAIGWAVAYEDEKTIDQINILQATQSAMHKAIRETLNSTNELNSTNSIHPFLLVDGNYFKPFTTYDKEKQIFKEVPHVCVTSGDDTYSVIAAASILAKVERDNYIAELCAENSDLDAKYGINKNKGYGTLEHRKGIQMHGLSPWHRRSFKASRLEDVVSISEPLTHG
jgi:ribonuclease HII